MKQIYRDNNSRANIYLITRVIYFRKPIKLQRFACRRCCLVLRLRQGNIAYTLLVADI